MIHQAEQKKQEEIRQADIKQKQLEEQGGDLSVAKAREMAARLNAQMEIGVAQAEAKKI